MDEMTKPLFAHLCVIGLGLIGASLVQAVHNANQRRSTPLVGKITAMDTNATSIKDAINAGVIADGSTQIGEAVKGADIVVIAVPVKAMASVMSALKDAMDAGKLAKDCLISDVGSTKQSVATLADEIFGAHHHFIGGHPIAGAENSGFHARNGELFVQHKLILCPTDSTDLAQLAKLRQLWQGVGADVIEMDAKRHDEILAYTSHLPHLLAFSLTHQLASHDDNLDIFRYAAGGFRDFSRIAASHPVMWHDIFIANKSALLNSLDEFQQHLNEFKEIIETQNSQKLLDWLATSRHARRHFGHMLAKKSTHKPNSIITTDAIKDTIMSQSYHIRPQNHITGTITVPGDKSISHRSIMFGSLADGVTHVSGFLQGEDALATLQAFADMGVKIERDGDKVTIHGVGIDGLQAPKEPLYMGNSGTSMRLLAGILSAQKFDSVMTGDVSLSKRPMERVAKPLREMGAVIQSTGEKGTAPLSITGS